MILEQNLQKVSEIAACCSVSQCYSGLPSYIPSFLSFPPCPPSSLLSSPFPPLPFVPPSPNLWTLWPYKENHRKSAAALQFPSPFSAT